MTKEMRQKKNQYRGTSSACSTDFKLTIKGNCHFYLIADRAVGHGKDSTEMYARLVGSTENDTNGPEYMALRVSWALI